MKYYCNHMSCLFHSHNVDDLEHGTLFLPFGTLFLPFGTLFLPFGTLLVSIWNFTCKYLSLLYTYTKISKNSFQIRFRPLLYTISM
jgi:hypothetical protein